MKLICAAFLRPVRNSRRSQLQRLTLLVLALIGLEASAQNDVLFFANGDRLTGEIERLDRGKLFFDTAATPEIGVEWDEVAFLTSRQRLELEVESGIIYLGTLSQTDEPGQLSMQTANGTVVIPMAAAVRMTPIEETLIEQFDVDVTMGYNFTKASDLSQFNLGLNVGFRRERNGMTLALDTVMTDETDQSTRRQNLDLSYDRFFDNRWVAKGLLSFERNDQLGIDLRSSIGAARGRFLRQTNQQRLAVYGGIILNREEVDGTNALPGANLTEDSTEAVGVIQAEWFRYDEPELDIISAFIVYPSLSESGRVRTEFDLSFRWEVVSDLFWDITLYHDFDNQPPSAQADEADYGIITSVGWDF